MAKSIFPQGKVAFQNDIAGTGAVSAYTELYLDGGGPVSFCMINQSGGKQNARIQVQATLDGKFYAIGAADGVGSYEMLFIDGVDTNGCKSNTSTDSILSKYVSLKDLKARTATVKIYAASGATSKPCGKFSGIINGMSTRLVEEQDGNLLLYVGLSMIGGWSN